AASHSVTAAPMAAPARASSGDRRRPRLRWRLREKRKSEPRNDYEKLPQSPLRPPDLSDRRAAGRGAGHVLYDRYQGAPAERLPQAAGSTSGRARNLGSLRAAGAL